MVLLVFVNSVVCCMILGIGCLYSIIFLWLYFIIVCLVLLLSLFALLVWVDCSFVCF